MTDHKAARPNRAPATSRFRDDIDPANTWVVSDTHFGHDNIVGFCHRPVDHEQVMIAEWRAQVPDDATVIHLGDLCYKGNGRFKHIVAPELTGERKLLIQGNHDKQRFSFYRDSGFKLARPFSIVVDCSNTTGQGIAVSDPAEFDSTMDVVVSFSHYPWSDDEEGRRQMGYDLRLHGHIHNNGYSRDSFVPFIKGHVNLSLEQTKYRPVNLKALLDGVLLGQYSETTPEQYADAQRRKTQNLIDKEGLNHS